MNDLDSKLNPALVENQFNLPKLSEDLFEIESNNQELCYFPICQNQNLQSNQSQQIFQNNSSLPTSSLSPSNVQALALPEINQNPTLNNQANVQQLTSNYLSSNYNLRQFSSNNQLFLPNTTVILTSPVSKNSTSIPFHEDNSKQVNLQLVQSNEPINNNSQSVSTTPIDMISQEYMKKERKKLRNRLAATKCRQKKQQKITQLEETINILRNFVNELEKQRSKLEETVQKLKNLLHNHVQAGCKIDF